MIRFAYVLAALLFFGLVGARYDPQTGFTRLIRFSDPWNDKRLAKLQSLPIAIDAPESGGYDGQFYAQIAIDPLLRSPDLEAAIDAPAYRARRILVPATAALVGCGNPWWTLQVYALINVFCWIVLAWRLRVWIKGTDWMSFARWFGCMFSMGVLESVRQSLVDLPALLLLALAIESFARSEGNRSTLWLALGNLAKETTLLGAVALESIGFLRPGNRLSAFIKVSLTAVPLGLWWLYINHRFAPGAAGNGFGNFTWPFLGLFSETKVCVQALLEGNFDGRFSFGTVAIIALLTQSVVVLWQRDMESPWWRVGSAYALLLPFLGLWVWSGYWAACRALLPLTIAFNLLLPSKRTFWPLWTIGNLALLHGVWRFV